MNYDSFVASKLRPVLPQGLDFTPKLSSMLFPFQVDCVGWGLQRGRAALFEDCGLGKGPQLLEWSRVVAEHTGGRVLVLAPLAVAAQLVREAAKFGIRVKYARTGADAGPPGTVTITNYEMLRHFDASDFVGVALDESSILKAYSGIMKRQITAWCDRLNWRLFCTATPAPNDQLELGNHAEGLGVLTSHEMLARWFLPDTSQAGAYRLKGHAVEPYWDWVSSWARCLGSPADLGYDATGYVLPELVEHVHDLPVDIVTGRGDGELFRSSNLSATAIHKEKRITLDARAHRIADLVSSEPGESAIIWTDTDYEEESIIALLPGGAVAVRGGDSLEAKERALLGFADGSIRWLVTKPRIAGFGLNWQHCARVYYVGPTFSYESYYQTVRRCWRFGQSRPVHVHVAMGSTEVPVWDAMKRKARDHEAMKVEMYAAMRRARERRDEAARAYQPRHTGRLPEWLTSAARNV